MTSSDQDVRICPGDELRLKLRGWGPDDCWECVGTVTKMIGGREVEDG